MSSSFDEPTGWGAVVEDNTGAYWTLYAPEAGAWVNYREGKRGWSEIDTVRIVSAGVGAEPVEFERVAEIGHDHDAADVCKRECGGWAKVQREKRRALRRAKRKVMRTRLCCLLSGGHEWLRMYEGDGALAFIDCRKCGFRP